MSNLISLIIKERKKKNKQLRLLSAIIFVSHFKCLTLKVPIKTAADSYVFFFFFFFVFFLFLEKTSSDISFQLSTWQMIHIKCQDLFSLKN